MPPALPPSSSGAADARERHAEAPPAGPLQRRLPLIALESLLQRLAGLMLQHPPQAPFVAAMTRRAQRLRPGRDLAPARQLEADYEAHLARCGIEETWFDRATDEATLLAHHYRQLDASPAAQPARGLLAWLRPRRGRDGPARPAPPDGAAET